MQRVHNRRPNETDSQDRRDRHTLWRVCLWHQAVIDGVDDDRYGHDAFEHNAVAVVAKPKSATTATACL